MAFGGINYLIFRPAVYYVDSLVNDTVSACSLFGLATAGPLEVRNDRTRIFGDVNIYSVRRDKLVASLGIASRDFSLVLMFDPQADHSFVYYAASIDFVGDYLQSMHSNDDSFFALIALADNTLIRVAPSKIISVGNIVVTDGEEHTMTLNLGDTLRVFSNEDLTGSRVTANKAILFHSGHRCTPGRIANCSVLTEQIPPYNSWGNTFVLHTNVSGLRGNMFKIIASDVGANVLMNCITDGTDYEANNFTLGFRQHTVLSVTHDYCTVKSDENILIIQFRDSSPPLMDTFMTIIPALVHYEDNYVFNTYRDYTNYIAITVKDTDNITNNSIMIDNSPVTVRWEIIELDGDVYYFSTVMLTVGRHAVTFSEGSVEFGAVIYGSNEDDMFALPAGMRLNIAENLARAGLYSCINFVYTLLSCICTLYIFSSIISAEFTSNISWHYH